jgi:hypothetical protein
MWFFSESLFEYLKERSIGRKIIDMFIVIMVFTWIAAIYMIATNFSSIQLAFQNHNIDMKSLIQLDKNINEILNSTMGKIDSDRVSLSRFHNSVLDLQGRHFVYESFSNEVVKPGVSSIAQLRQNSLISMINIWLQLLIKDQCVYMTNLSETDLFYEYYKQAGIKSDIKCPVLNTHGNLVGYLDIAFTTKMLTIEQMKIYEPLIRESASKIGAILSLSND